ncbi:MAG: hypothetical protein K0S78_4471 [Thermomicrobiales bacterium]|nr:hypothetical protein [Thermomicrobiales bacterium]
MRELAERIVRNALLDTQTPGAQPIVQRIIGDLNAAGLLRDEPLHPAVAEQVAETALTPKEIAGLAAEDHDLDQLKPQGPEPWEIIRFLQEQPEGGWDAMRAAADEFNISTTRVSAALAYYSDHRSQVDEAIHRAEMAEIHADWHDVDTDTSHPEGDKE